MHPLALLKPNLEHLLTTQVFSRETKFYHCLGCTTSLAAESCDHLSWSRRTAQGFPLAHDPVWKQFHWRRLGTKHSGFNDWPPEQAGWEGSRQLDFKAEAVCTGVLLCPSWCAFLNCQAHICPFLTLLSLAGFLLHSSSKGFSTQPPTPLLVTTYQG